MAASKDKNDESYEVAGSSVYAFSLKAIARSISSKSHVAEFFQERPDGALIVHNVLSAATSRIISKTEAESLWQPFNISSLMVSTLTCHKDGSSKIFGYIYLAAEHDIFNARHIDEMCKITDLVTHNLAGFADQYWPK